MRLSATLIQRVPLVFTADDTVTGQEVIVKAFQPFVRHLYRVEAFKRESEMLQRLDHHEGIIQIIAPWTELKIVLAGYGITLEIPYYVLERAENDLGGIIADGTASTEWVLLAFRFMCKAVQHIHRLGIVHRDLKPGNFLILPNGEIRLSDFGAARLLTEGAKPLLDDYAGFPPGDIPYTAPEIVCSLHDVDPRFAYKGDVFSLGAILFEMFTGVMLGPQIYDLNYQRDLMGHMAAVPREYRQRVFDEFIGELADKRPLPDLRAFHPSAQKCVLPMIEELYKHITALDYRKRAGNFEYVFLKINQALLVLRNEEKYRRWREKREQYRRDLQKKYDRITARFGKVRVGETK